MAFQKVASLNDIVQGRSVVVEVSGKEIALFNVSGEIFAISNACPHQGGPLGEGEVEDTVVTCPLHGWRFRLDNGEGLTMPHSKVERFDVKIEGNDILIDL